LEDTSRAGATQPFVSIRALERALSPQRLRAYGDPSDRDDADRVARYIWNLALSNALQPVLHALEVAFRNEISRAAAKLTSGRSYRTSGIDSWLDADPSMLMERERRKVMDAKERLGSDPSSQTEGHLIAKLDFGFWVALCRDAYTDTRSEGPRLWPRALSLAFRRRPPSVTTRAEILHRFDRIRRYRNRVAHHEPIWDREYLAEHDYVLDSLAWISPALADALRPISPAGPTFRGGPAAYRPHAETLLGTSAGTPEAPWRRFGALPAPQQLLLAPLFDALVLEKDADPRLVIRRWAESL
jgi:hypothetical protein